jgi:ribonuclease HII
VTPVEPTLHVEKGLFREGFARVGGLDEVGTGSASGPLRCCLVLIDSRVTDPPAGLRDSKLLSPGAREALVPTIKEWILDFAIGSATAAEIDRYGLTIALRLAGHRALSRLALLPEVVLLDGQRDWLTPPEQPGLVAPVYPEVIVPPVRTLVKADRLCASVAAASVLAKVDRDVLMVELAKRYPGYGWEINKGYATPGHLDAIRRMGQSSQHRHSWSLPAQGGNPPSLSPRLGATPSRTSTGTSDFREMVGRSDQLGSPA